MLAIGLYNIQYTYDPELILIGGGISVREDLLERLTKEMEAIISLVDVATVIPKVEKCYFKANANLIGAAYHYRSEEHTSELQSRGHLVCRLLLEKKKTKHTQS